MDLQQIKYWMYIYKKMCVYQVKYGNLLGLADIVVSCQILEVCWNIDVQFFIGCNVLTSYYMFFVGMCCEFNSIYMPISLYHHLTCLFFIEYIHVYIVLVWYMIILQLICHILL